MVSLTLKVILHVAENDSKYRDVAPLREELNSAAAIVALDKEKLKSLIAVEPMTFRTPVGYSHQ